MATYYYGKDKKTGNNRISANKNLLESGYKPLMDDEVKLDFAKNAYVLTESAKARLGISEESKSKSKGKTTSKPKENKEPKTSNKAKAKSISKVNPRDKIKEEKDRALRKKIYNASVYQKYYRKHRGEILLKKKLYYAGIKGLEASEIAEKHRQAKLKRRRASKPKSKKLKNKYSNIKPRIEKRAIERDMNADLKRQLQDLNNQYNKSRKQLDFSKVGSSKGMAAAPSISVSFRDTGKFIETIEKLASTAGKKDDIALAGNEIYFTLVSDFVPYDYKRENMINEIYNNGKKSLSNKFKKAAGRKISIPTTLLRRIGYTGKRGQKNTSKYKKLKNKFFSQTTERDEAIKYADKKYNNFIDKQRFMSAFDRDTHTLDDVVINKDGVTWKRKKVDYIYNLNLNDDFQQDLKGHVWQNVRGSYWNERALSNTQFIRKWQRILQACFDKNVLSNGKSVSKTAENAGYGKY